MPRSTVILKPVTRPITRSQAYVHSHDSCKAGLPVSSLSSCSSSVDIASSLSMAPPSSLVSTPADSPLVLPSTNSNFSASSFPLPPPACSSASSSSITDSQTLPSPNSSLSCSSQQTQQDTLYEYVKGLQDALKVPDPDLAERLLEDIAQALNVPSAVSLIISANGARLIASCVKHFRSNGGQKKVTGKSGRSSNSMSKHHSSLKEEHDPTAEQQQQQETENLQVPESVKTGMDDSGIPSVQASTNESRRKRQRTIEDTDEEEEGTVREMQQSVDCEEAAKPTKSSVDRKQVKVKGRCKMCICGAKHAVTDQNKRILSGCVSKDIIISSTVGASSSNEEGVSTSGENQSVDDPTDGGKDSVYLLAKAAGMSNVVATGCSALDKLLNAALQMKRGSSKVGNGSGKRVKALSAEMYVALTEAFVDMVLVLKDNVDLLSWCLNCLGSILPPGSAERNAIDSVFNGFGPYFGKESAEEDGCSKSEASSSSKQQTVSHTQIHSSCGEQLVDQKLFPSKALLKLASKYRDQSNCSDFSLKVSSKTSSGSYVAAARSLSTTKTTSSKGVITSSFCSGITSESTSNSISALAAVAYAATVPMLAEKAVKAVLNAMQSCDIESHSTLAALRALSAHLSSTNTKSCCDDAFAFIMAAMREFVSDAEMQAESCIALGSLTRAVPSATGHAAWAAIILAMDHHRTDLNVQRAGCSALQVLCTRTGLGVPEWRSTKRPLRASKDADREAGAKTLIASMSAFSNDVRIQWHGCSTLWTLVHSAGVKSLANMVKNGAVSAVVGAMTVCRMNEMMQQEGCNVIGTMVRTLAENGHEIGLFLADTSASDLTVENEKCSSSREWWKALWAVVNAMKMFSKSKALQSNGTFALGCILKGSGDTATFDVVRGIKTADVVDDESKSEGAKVQSIENGVTAVKPFLAKDVVENVERISAAVDVTMTAMREFPKVETVQVWGCAVLQQAFLAYVHYAKSLAPVEASTEKAKSSSGQTQASTSPSDALAKLVLSQATAAMCMISGTMAMSQNPTGTPQNSNSGKAATTRVGASKPVAGGKFQPSAQFFASVRQSWCAALGAIGDVFGYLTRNSEVAIGKASSDCMEFFRGKGFLDRSVCNLSHMQPMGSKGCCGDELSESGDSVVSGGGQESKPSGSSSVSGDEIEEKKSSDSLRSGAASWIDWSGFGASQQQAVKDIKAWQEATESMAKIAEVVGFPMAVKNAILSIRTIFYKLEDPETVIWACHALVTLYLTWENLHLFKSGMDFDREQYKAKIWGDGEAGVAQLVDLVVHWTKQNRPDVASLALQALYGACVFAATIQEIEKVFALGGCGAEAVLGAMQKALVNGNAQHRKKVVQQGCCVLATVCGYSIDAQVAVAAHGGADLILTALDRYNEDNQIQMNGLHALGIDSHAQTDFDALWNLAIARSCSSGAGSKAGRRKRGSQSSSSFVVGLTHIFKEGTHYTSKESEGGVSNWNPHFERLVLDGGNQIGLFRSALLAAPGCGGPTFAVELMKRLNQTANFSAGVAQMQAHICCVIGYMAELDAVWRQNLIDEGIFEAVLSTVDAVHKWKQNLFQVFSLHRPDCKLQISCAAADDDDGDDDDSVAATKLLLNTSSENIDFNKDAVDSRIQCAAALAIAGLLKDYTGSYDVVPVESLVQALVVALHRYGGLLPIPSYGMRAEKAHLEVCSPARLALARLGVTRISTVHEVVFLAHEAAETGDLTCLHALALKGADVLVADANGRTGEWYAERSGQLHVAQFFKDQVQLQMKKKAREKAKAKNRHNHRKAQVAFEEERQVAWEEAETAISATEVITDNFQPVPDAVEERNSDKPASGKTKKKGLKSEKRSKLGVKSDECIATAVNVVDAGVVKEQQQQQQQQQEEEKEEEKEKEKEEEKGVDEVNMVLHEAMASGDVESMEVAIRRCEEEHDECVVDERLLKKVKGALAKRLKRRDKANALEEELCGAIEEGSCDRLQAAIFAVERVPRFAGALKEKVDAAKDMLLEMGGSLLVQSLSDVKECDNDTEVSGDGTASEKLEDKCFELVEAIDELLLHEEEEKEEVKDDDEVVVNVEEFDVHDDDDEASWICTTTKSSRRRREKENVEAHLQAAQNLANRPHQQQQQQQQQRHTSSRRERGGMRQRRQRASGEHRRQQQHQNHQQHRQQHQQQKATVSDAATASATATLPPPPAAAVTVELLPPLLPTPLRQQQQQRLPSPAAGNSRSVIMPPKAAAAAAAAAAATSTACEHNPITPQLFPSTTSPLVDYNNNNNSSRGYLSQLSLLLSPSAWSPSKPSSTLIEADDAFYHDERDEQHGLLPPGWDTWSSTDHDYDHDHEYYDPYYYNTRTPPWSTSHSPSSNSPGYLGALLATLFPSERPPSSSTTLFSAALGEFPPHQPPTSSSAGVAAAAAGAKVDCGGVGGGGWFPFAEGSTSLFSEDINTVSVPVPVPQGLTLQSRLQAALLEASLEDSCCICFDMPKDAALVPCGHRMCKVCAEQMHSRREHCPICNRCEYSTWALNVLPKFNGLQDQNQL